MEGRARNSLFFSRMYFISTSEMTFIYYSNVYAQKFVIDPTNFCILVSFPLLLAYFQFSLLSTVSLVPIALVYLTYEQVEVVSINIIPANTKYLYSFPLYLLRISSITILFLRLTPFFAWIHFSSLFLLLSSFPQTNKNRSDKQAALGMTGDEEIVRHLLKEIPSWAQESETQRVEWFNMILGKLWPHISRATYIKMKVNSLLSQLPSLLPFLTYFETCHLLSISFLSSPSCY